MGLALHQFYKLLRHPLFPLLSLYGIALWIVFKEIRHPPGGLTTREETYFARVNQTLSAAFLKMLQEAIINFYYMFIYSNIFQGSGPTIF